MKKLKFRVVSLFLVLVLIVSCMIPATAKGLENTNLLSRFATSLASKLPDKNSFQSADSYESKHFFEGTGFETTEAEPGAKWYLGFDETITTPDNLLEKDYYLGGSFDTDFSPITKVFKYRVFKENGNIDIIATVKRIMSMLKVYAMFLKRTLSHGLCREVGQKYTDTSVRSMALSDSTGRGISAIAVVDCIGLTNKTIREIRSRITQKAAGIKFSDITIAATHTHSAIDTLGIWTDSIGKIVKNLFGFNIKIEADPKYMEYLCEKVSDSVVNACKNMEPGIMTYTSKKLFNAYFYTKNRSGVKDVASDMTRFIFRPDSKTSTPTLIASLNAHPYYTGVATSNYEESKGDGYSADYVYYMAQTVCKAGYNFLFFNGAEAALYHQASAIVRMKCNQLTERDMVSKLIGEEMGKIVLALSMTAEEIKADPYLNTEDEDNAYIEKLCEEYKEYTREELKKRIFLFWYENWEKSEEIELEPILNTAFKEVMIPVNNPIFIAAGKEGLSSYNFVTKDGKYYIVTEIGYMELGNVAKIALVPGELFSELMCGGRMLQAEYAESKTDFNYPTLRDIFGEKTIVFGLANGMIGYIVPDNDYCLSTNVKRHYHELLSLGKNTASILIQHYEEIAKNK